MWSRGPTSPRSRSSTSTAGDRVYIEGEIQYRSYEDRDGATRYVTEIRATELVMLGGRNERSAQETTREPVTAGSVGEEPSALPDDDLPF